MGWWMVKKGVALNFIYHGYTTHTTLAENLINCATEKVFLCNEIAVN